MHTIIDFNSIISMVYISLINYYILNWIFDVKIWIVTIFYKWKNKPINFVIISVHWTYILWFLTQAESLKLR